jgi:hypothetical protein
MKNKARAVSRILEKQKTGPTHAKFLGARPPSHALILTPYVLVVLLMVIAD